MVKFGIKVNTKALQSWEIHLNLTIDQTRQMTTTTQPIKFLTMAGECQVIDVRSPGEFEQGHVPGAINIPLFTDAERAVVGTLYVKTGQAEAIFKGLDIALVKVDVYIDSINKVCQKGPVLLHCWRGGLRSAVMAEVFSHAGYEVTVLEGGYKAYRTFIRGEFSRPARVIVLGGYTGSGKTDILKVLAARESRSSTWKNLHVTKDRYSVPWGSRRSPPMSNLKTTFMRGGPILIFPDLYGWRMKAG